MDDAAEFLKLNNDPVFFNLQRSERNQNKIPVTYKPMLSFNASKKEIERIITHFSRLIHTSNTTSEKERDNHFIVYLYNMYLIGFFTFFRLPR